MRSTVVSGVLVGVLLGLVVAPAQAKPTPYVKVTKLAPSRDGRTVKAHVAFHQPTLKRRGRDRLHVWLGARDDGQLSTLWRSTEVAIDGSGHHSLTVKLPRKKAERLRSADRLLLTTTQRHRAPGADLFATNYVATASAPASGGNLRSSGCPEVVGPGADLTDCDLTGAVLRGADLSGADLTGVKWAQADLKRADLTGAALVYNTSVRQAINPAVDNQNDFGYLTSLTVTSNGQTIALPANATFSSPITWRKVAVTGALQTVAVGPLIEVTAVLRDSPELQALGQVPAGAAVTFSLVVYRWDQAIRTYFPTFYTGNGSAAMPGTFKRAPQIVSVDGYDRTYNLLLNFVAQPSAGCGFYVVQSMPGSGSSVKWGMGC